MTREDIRTLIWQELQKFSVLLTGVSANATDQTGGGAIEDIGSLYPGLPSILQNPVMSPYGFASKTPDGVTQVVAKGGNHPLNRIILGHFDPSRPQIAAGETILYNQYGQVMHLKQGKVLIGSLTASHAYVLGDILQTCLSTVLSAIASHTHIDSVGGNTLPPGNASTFTGQKSSPVDDGKMLSTIISGAP